jgi:DNA-binding FadR family transcriptional regulator
LVLKRFLAIAGVAVGREKNYEAIGNLSRSMPSHLPSSPRHAALAPLDQRGRVAEVERRLSDAINGGVFADGEQLPTEAELAAQLGVATVTLREALVGLRRTGLVRTQRGRRGGSFVNAPPAEAHARLLDHVAALSVDELRDIADQRTAIAVAVAGLAAQRASRPDVERLDRHVEQLAGARDAAERRAADARFHVEMAATTRSPRLTGAEMDLQTEVGALVWLARAANAALTEHRAVLAAIRARDPKAARERMAAHVAADMEAVVALHLERREPEPTDVLDRVHAALEDVFTAIGDLGDALLALSPELSRSGLAPIRATAHGILEAHPLVAGTGVVFAPDVLADAPRWLEWWRRSPAGAPVFLNANLDSGDPDFYDYEQAEWFTTPRDTGERWIAGPFVDVSGTNDHILTLTLPIVRSDRFLGVAGADITVGMVEAIAGGPLAAIDGEAALVNHRGRIVATNTPHLMVGTLWPGAEHRWPPADAGSIARDERLLWSVAVRPRG